jgi:hypothetical protein
MARHAGPTGAASSHRGARLSRRARRAPAPRSGHVGFWRLIRGACRAAVAPPVGARRPIARRTWVASAGLPGHCPGCGPQPVPLSPDEPSGPGLHHRDSSGRNPTTGKLVRRTLYGRTRQSVADQLAQTLSGLHRGTLTMPQKLTVGAWLDQWLNIYKKPELRKIAQNRADDAGAYQNCHNIGHLLPCELRPGKESGREIERRIARIIIDLVARHIVFVLVSNWCQTHPKRLSRSWLSLYFYGQFERCPPLKPHKPFLSRILLRLSRGGENTCHGLLLRIP